MLIDEVTFLLSESSEEPVHEMMVWARSGQKVVRKYRCQSGHRKNRVVAKPAQCFGALDMKKRISMKKTKARFGSRLARKAKKTKRVNPASRRVQALNKR